MKQAVIRWFVGLWAWGLVWLACAPGWSQRAEAVHLDAPAAIRALCASATAAPPQVEPAQVPSVISNVSARPAPPAPFPRAYLEGRLANLTRIYTVDVASRDFRVAEHNPATQQLMVATPEGFALFDGMYALSLVDSPLLVFEAPSEVAEQVEMGQAAGRVMLRLTFMLESVTRPELPYCREAGGALTMRGHLLGASLWRASRSGDEPGAPGPVDVLASMEVSEGWDLAAVLGLGAGRQPEQGSPTVTVHLARASAEAVSQEDQARLRGDIELLARPCFLAALGAGGPRAASMTVELTHERGAVRAVRVTIDQSGHPPLGACVAQSARQVRLPEAFSGALRFNLFFERP